VRENDEQDLREDIIEAPYLVLDFVKKTTKKIKCYYS
jgi:hypothetical protein